MPYILNEYFDALQEISKIAPRFRCLFIICAKIRQSWYYFISFIGGRGLIKKIVIFFFIGLLLSSCEKNAVKDYIDKLWFNYLGNTAFTDAGLITTKELHLDSGVLLGKKIIFEGEVISKGQYDTFVLMKDSYGRILVVLTNVVSAEKALQKENQPYKLRVLGVVERGKKGLPYIMALSMSAKEIAKND